MSAERPENQPQFIETLLIPVPYSTRCVWEGCKQIIPQGEEAMQSPSDPRFFYHIECMKELIKSAGKDPDTFLKIINGTPPSRN